MKKARARAGEPVSEKLWREYVTDFLAPLLEELNAPVLTTEQRLRLKLEFFAQVIDGVDRFATEGFAVLKGRRKGGSKTAEKSRGRLAARNARIIAEYKAMLLAGTPRREVAGNLSDRHPNLSRRQINRILGPIKKRTRAKRMSD